MLYSWASIIRGRQKYPYIKESTLLVKEVPHLAEESCCHPVHCGNVRVQFSASQPITMDGGSTLLFRLIEHQGLRRALAEALPPKAEWARYTRADDVLALLTCYALGLQRVAHVGDTGPKGDGLQPDPTPQAAGSQRLPSVNR